MVNENHEVPEKANLVETVSVHVAYRLDHGIDQVCGRLHVGEFVIMTHDHKRIALYPGMYNWNQNQSKLIVPKLTEDKAIDHLAVTEFEFEFRDVDFFRGENWPHAKPIVLKAQFVCNLFEQGLRSYKLTIDPTYVTLNAGNFTQELIFIGEGVKLRITPPNRTSLNGEKDMEFATQE